MQRALALRARRRAQEVLARRPAPATAAAQGPAAQGPVAQTPAAQTPAAQTPAAQTPAAQTPAAQTPAAQSPAAQTPAAEPPAPTPQAPTPAAPRPQAPDGSRLSDHRRYRTWKRAPGEAVKSSPAFLVAGLLHLVLLVALSFWTIAVHLQKEALPVEVRIAKPQRIIPVTAGVDRTETAALDALADATQRDLEAINEADTDDPFTEARGDATGQVNVFGAGGGGRSGVGRGGRKNNRGGSSKASDGAVTTGLEWLARHRNRDGVWTFLGAGHEHVEEWGKPNRTWQTKRGDVARTGMALLGFLLAGHSPGEPGRYQELVLKAEEWLVKQVGRDGRFQGGFNGYVHSIGTLALAECLARHDDQDLRQAVHRAVRCLVGHQSKRLGGWRYRGSGDSDTSVTSWGLLALKSAEAAGVSVPSESFQGVRKWVARVSAPSGGTGYTSAGDGGAAMNATGLFLRVILGEKPTTAMNRKAAEKVARCQLALQGKGISNFYAVYYSALALYQVGGELWKEFNPRIRDALINTQRKGTHCERGSWEGGGFVSDPVLATCFATLTLETYYRYMPVHGGVDHEERAPGAELSAGERLLDQARVAMAYARDGKAPAELLAAEAAYSRALGALRQEGAHWQLQEEALVSLVEVASLGEDRAAILTHSGAYLEALPKGEAADPRVTRARRRERFARVIRGANAAQSADDPERRREAEERVSKLARELRAEAPTLGKWSEHQQEAEEMIAALQEVEIRLGFARDPASAIETAWAAVQQTPAKGPLSRPERQLLAALLLHANQQLQQAKEAKLTDALQAGEQALNRISQRRLLARIDQEGLARMASLIEQARLRLPLALLAHDRLRRAVTEIRRFVRRFPTSSFRVQAEAIERGALARLAKLERATDAERARLGELVLAYAHSKPELEPSESMALADLLERAGRDEAARPLFREVTLRAKPALRAEAKLRLARLERRQGRLDVALSVLDTVDEQDRLDVVLERCLTWRARRDSPRALERYLELLKNLSATDHRDAWWEIAYAAGKTYLECGEVRPARLFLEGLRKKDRTFGQDAERRRRFLALMREADDL